MKAVSQRGAQQRTPLQPHGNVDFVTPPEKGGKGKRPLPFPPGLAVSLPAALACGSRGRRALRSTASLGRTLS
jgi:hypothetical protein